MLSKMYIIWGTQLTSLVAPARKDLLDLQKPSAPSPTATSW
jgi:hypothetical protein